MGTDTVREALGSLARSLRPATVFPAALLMLANAFLLSTQFDIDLDRLPVSGLAMMAALTLVVSYMFYASGYRLISFFSGLGWEHTIAGRILLARKRRKWGELVDTLESLHKERKLFENYLGFDPSHDPLMLKGKDRRYWQRLNAKLLDEETEFAFYYPSDVSRLRPTRFGNIIAAVTDYTIMRYGMDREALWPRLRSVLVETVHGDLVNRPKDALDFLMNTFIVVFLLGLHSLYLGLFLESWLLVVLAPVLAIPACWLLYTGMVWATDKWGREVRVAFDLYRHDLAKRLGLRPAWSFQSEHEQWKQVSQFLTYRIEGAWFPGFLSQHEIQQQETE